MPLIQTLHQTLMHDPDLTPTLTLTLIRFALLTSAFWFAAIFVGDTARTKWPSWLHPTPWLSRRLKGYAWSVAALGLALGSSAPYIPCVRPNPLPVTGCPCRHTAPGVYGSGEPQPPPKSPMLPAVYTIEERDLLNWYPTVALHQP